MQRRRSILLLIAAASVAGVSFTRAQTPQPPPQGQPVFRTGTNLVLVDVYPMKDGRIVPNLELKDFQVFEDGKPQTIDQFQFIKVEGRAPEGERRDPNTQEEGNAAAADPKNRVFVVYLDTKGVSIEGGYRARKPLVNMLNRIMAPNDLFGVMTTDMRPQDMVFGRQVLTTEDMLARNWPWGTRGSTVPDPADRDLDMCTRDPKTGQQLTAIDGGIERKLFDIVAERRHEEQVLQRLDQLVDYLSAIRQTRIALIVFTEGWLLYGPDDALLGQMERWAKYSTGPVTGVGPGGRLMTSGGSYAGSPASCIAEVTRLAHLTDRQMFLDLLRKASQANVAFYPVNPLGLTVFDLPISDMGAFAPGEVQFRRTTARKDALLEAASNTGGVAVVGSNPLDKGLGAIDAQLGAYYVLGYYSTNNKTDGKFRKIDVKLNVPGLQISARKGYLAPTAAPAVTPRDTTPPEIAAAAGARDAALGMLSRIRPGADLYGWAARTAPGELTVVAEVSGPLAEQGRWLSGADLQAIVTTAAGEPAGIGRGRLPAGQRGVAVRVPVTGSGPWHVQLRMRNDTDAVETTTETPPPAPTGAVAADPIVFRATPAAQSPLVPVADLLFRRTERLHVEWRLSGAAPNRQARLLDRNGQPLPIDVTVSEKPGAVLAADLVLGPLGPGDYLIELQLGDASTGARVLLPFRVQN